MWFGFCWLDLKYDQNLAGVHPGTISILSSEAGASSPLKTGSEPGCIKKYGG